MIQLSAAEFLERLSETGSVADVEVTEPTHLLALARKRSGSRAAETSAASRVEPDSYTVSNVRFTHGFWCDGGKLDARLVFQECRFAAGFSASGVRANAGLELLRCTFEAQEDDYAVRLDGARVEGDLHFRANVVKGHIVARRMRVTGDLLFNGLKVFARGITNPPVARFYEPPFGALSHDFAACAPEWRENGGPAILNLRGSTIDGTLNLGGLPYEEDAGLIDPYQFEGDYPMLTVIGGDVDSLGLTIGHNLQLWNMRVIGTLNLNSIRVGRKICGQTLIRRAPAAIACRLEISGSLQANQAEIGDLAVDGALIRDDLSCSSSKMPGVLSGGSVYIAAARWCDLEVGGRLVLNASTIGFVGLRGADIRGRIVMVAGSLHRFYLGPHLRTRLIESDEADRGERLFRLYLHPSRARNIEFASVHVREALTLAGLDLNPVGAVEPATGQGAYERSITITGCEIRGNLVFTTDGITESAVDAKGRYTHNVRSLLDRHDIAREAVDNYVTLIPPETPGAFQLDQFQQAWFEQDALCPARIPGLLDLSHNKIGGLLDISHVFVGHEIRLDDTTVGRDLRASRFGSGERGVQTKQALYETRCTTLDMQNFQCKGDADVTGLVLHRTHASAPERAPGIRAPYAVIGGDLLLWPDHFEYEDESRPHGQFTGTDLRLGDAVLDLRGAAVGRLVVCGDNFATQRADKGEQPEKAKPRARVDLENARLGRLEIRHPVPAHMKLAGINVVTWDLDPDETYLAVLRNTDDFFSGDVYTQVEQSLRNDGKHDLADEVYIQMRKRLEKKMLNPPSLAAAGHTNHKPKGEYGRWLLSRMHRLLTNYGTSAARPLACIVAIVALNALLFSEPRNVAASPAYFGTTPAQTESRERNPGELEYTWGFGDVVAMTTRFSVPLITLAMSEPWEPSSKPAIVPCTAGLSQPSESGTCSVPLRVATLARLLGYLSWIFWPLFIIRVSRVLNPRG